MRSAFVVAGLVAIVAADTYTVTKTEDVTITSCAPTHTNCPYKSQTTASADSDFSWGEWDDADISSTSTDPAATTTESWEEWDVTVVTKGTETKTVTKAKTTGTVTSVKATTTTDPAWGEWDDADISSTSTDPSATSTESWGEWDDVTATTTLTSAAATTTDPSACPSYTATGPPEWFSLLPSSVLSSIEAKWTGAPPADWCYYTYSTASTISTKVSGTGSKASETSSKASGTGSKATGTGSKATGTGTGVAATTVSSDAASSTAWNVWGSSTTSSVTTASVTKASATTSGPVKAFTGAANSNAGSVALAGLAAVAAMILA